MGLEAYAEQIIAFVREHQAWAAPIVFLLCFAESLAFISLLIPAWAALVGIGTMIGASGISFWPVWIAGSVGAALGDWVSYWLGHWLGPAIYEKWPLNKHPKMVATGESFLKRWGALAIVIGRFSGPLRAVVPIAAGIFQMPQLRFQLANWSSAFLWAAVLLLLGDVTGKAIRWISG